MSNPTGKYRNLTQLEVIELLRMLKDHTETDTAEHFIITQQAVSYYRKKYHADTPEIIDKVTAQLEKEDSEIEYERMFKKQQECVPTKFYFKCHTCKYVASERNIEGLLEHISRYHQEEKLLTQQTI